MSRLIKSLLLAGGALGLLAIVAGIALLLHFSQDLPDVEQAQDLELHQPLRVYGAGGEIIGEFGAERREALAWEDVPQVLVDAFLAAEDDRYFEHPGVDYQGLLRAAWVLALTGEKSQGGSTITMQLARNLFLSNEKSYRRKIREILLALELEQRFDKTEILRLYLNKIFLGQRAYGVAAAARIYYGKSVDELTLDEAAMIAGLPKAPSAYNPVANPHRAELRRNYVLRRMRELGSITPEQEAAARAVPVKAALAESPVLLDAHYVAEMVRAEMYGRYGDAIYTAGVHVHTSIDAELQRAAADAVRRGVLDYDARHAWRGPEATRELADGQPLTALIESGEAARIDAANELFEDIDRLGGLERAIVLRSGLESTLTLREDGALLTVAAADIPWEQARGLPTGAVVYLRPLGASSSAAEERDDESLDGAAEGAPAGGDSDVAQAAQRWQLAQRPQVQAALVALDPSDGAVVALVGGFDFFASKFNRAVQARRQPGSSFKPFLYSAALHEGLTPATVMNDAPVVFDDPALGGAWKPENYDGRFRGPTRLREALVRSSNLVTIRILQRVGIGDFRDYVTRFGLDKSDLPRDLSIALGSGTFSPLELAGAYAVIANSGYRVRPWHVDRVETAAGELIESPPRLRVCPDCLAAGEADAVADPENGLDTTAMPSPAPRPTLQPGREPFAERGAPQPAGASAAPEPTAPVYEPAPRVVDAANMYIVSDMMRDVIQRGTGRKARSLGRRDIAGKTGTTNEQRDAWFAGFHPDLVVVTWIGFDDLTPMGRGETGGRAALPLWIDFMGAALPALPQRQATPPSGVVTARIDPDTGELSSIGEFELFLEGFVPEAPVRRAWEDPAEVRSEDELSDEVLEDLF